MKWKGQYIVMRNGSLLWVEGYELKPGDAIYELLKESGDAQQWFQYYGRWGIRIGEAGGNPWAN